MTITKHHETTTKTTSPVAFGPASPPAHQSLRLAQRTDEPSSHTFRAAREIIEMIVEVGVSVISCRSSPYPTEKGEGPGRDDDRDTLGVNYHWRGYVFKDVNS